MWLNYPNLLSVCPCSGCRYVYSDDQATPLWNLPPIRVFCRGLDWVLLWVGRSELLSKSSQMSAYFKWSLLMNSDLLSSGDVLIEWIPGFCPELNDFGLSLKERWLNPNSTPTMGTVRSVRLHADRHQCLTDILDTPDVRVMDFDSVYPLPWTWINTSETTSRQLPQSILWSKRYHGNVGEQS